MAPKKTLIRIKLSNTLVELGEDLIVELPNGKVQGSTLDTPSGKVFYSWRGIPYGKPPIDELRFLPPVEAEAWDDVLDASEDSPSCVFFSITTGYPLPANQSEDCLYINVYSPVAVGSNSSVNATLPVMFWIYGGGFSTGTGDFSYNDPTEFLEEDVIVVTFNYRLGPLGFLTTEDEIIPGNAGLKDQVLALTWTSENIGYFGGNASDITLFGESAGAISIGYHIISPLTRNLFKAAIMESGSSLSDTLQSEARESAYTLASEIDSSITTANSSSEVREVLQAVDLATLVNLTYDQGTGPVIEFESNSSFITQPFYETVESGDTARVPIIIGFNSEESLINITDIDIANLQAKAYDLNNNLLLPNMKIQSNVSSEDVAKEIYESYVGEDGSFENYTLAALEFWSDNKCLRNVHKYAILQSNYTSVYMYQFSYYGTIGKDHLILEGAGKVGHMDEIGYLFNISTKSLATDEDYLMRKRLVKLWTNFAKTLNPTPDDSSAELLQNVTWEPMTADNIQYLNIDTDLEMQSSRKINQTHFWDYIWTTYSYRPYVTF